MYPFLFFHPQNTHLQQNTQKHSMGTRSNPRCTNIQTTYLLHTRELISDVRVLSRQASSQIPCRRRLWIINRRSSKAAMATIPSCRRRRLRHVLLLLLYQIAVGRREMGQMGTSLTRWPSSHDSSEDFFASLKILEFSSHRHTSPRNQNQRTH
jgi:hypothetical protein